MVNDCGKIFIRGMKMKYYIIDPLIAAGEFFFTRTNKIKNGDYGSLYFEYFYTREKTIPKDFIFKYELEDLSDEVNFDDMDVLKTAADNVLSQKLIEPIYDAIISSGELYKAQISYEQKIYDHYLVYLVKNLWDLFADEPSNPDNRWMKPKIKVKFKNRQFDIAMDIETHITVFSEKLIDKLQKAVVKFDLKLVPFEND